MLPTDCFISCTTFCVDSVFLLSKPRMSLLTSGMLDLDGWDLFPHSSFTLDVAERLFEAWKNDRVVVSVLAISK